MHTREEEMLMWMIIFERFKTYLKKKKARKKRDK